MEVFFFTSAGAGLFVRNDMEEGHWVQEEMTVNAVFPLDPGKLIRYGMRMAFRDPATDNLEVFEIRTVQNAAADGSQQITAEHIVISELTDEHINTTEITDKTPEQALRTVLTGTLWSIGNVSAVNVSSCDISRGTVWQAVSTLCHNWNVYIIPRVTLSGSGSITGRYLDILPARGVFRGVRLSIDKNMMDPVVSYNDTDVLTALYGYGGNVDVAQNNGDDISQELTFAGVTWTAENGHPAKPAGQTYLEWPEKTSLYGRNGRPRFGFYQNGDIKDAATLLQKTWETLQKTTEPKINISGTVTDLHRLGYADQPIRLHDLAIVEIRQTGEVFRKEIIKNDVDLVNPDQTMPEIGDYIPNIIYISRESYNYATGNGSAGGHSGGSGGSRGKTELETNTAKTYSQWVKLDDRIGMVVGMRNGASYIKAGEIVLSINEQTGESTALLDAHYVNIGTLQTKRILATATDEYAQVIGTYVWENVLDGNGQPVVDAAGNPVRRVKGLDGSGNLVWKNGAAYGIWDKGELSAGLFVEKTQGSGTYTHIRGDKVKIGTSSSSVDLASAMVIDTYNTIQSVKFIKQTLFSENVYANGADIEASVLNGKGGDVKGKNIKVKYQGGLTFEAQNPTSSDPTIDRSDALGLKDIYSHAQLVNNDDGTATLWYLPATTPVTLGILPPSAENGWISSGTFSKATSLSGQWGGIADTTGDIYTITGTPSQNPPLQRSIGFSGTASSTHEVLGLGNASQPSVVTTDLTKAGRKQINLDVAVTRTGIGETLVNVYKKTLSGLNASGVYDNGWKKAWGDFASKILDSQKDPETDQLVENQVWIKYPNSAVDGNPIYRRYTVDADAEKAYIKLGNTTVAEMTHNQYALGQANGETTGWNAARGVSLIPDAQASGGSIQVKIPSTTYGTPIDRTFELYSETNNQVVLRYNTAQSGQPVYRTVAQITHNKYNAGWDNAEGRVGLPSSGSGSTITFSYPEKITSGNTTTRQTGSKTYVLRSTANDAYISIENDNETWTDYAHIVHNQFNLGKASVDTTAYYNSGARAGSWVDYFDAANANASINAASAMTNEDGQGISYGGELAAGWALGLYYIKADRTKHYKAYWKVPSPPVVNLQEKSIDCSYSMTVTPDAGYTGLSKVNINHKHGGTSMTLTRGAYNSNSRTYKWTGELSASVTGSNQSWTVYWF